MSIQKLRDPWAKREAWRNTPQLSIRNSLRHTWPGLPWGVGAFIIYLGADAVISRMNNQKS
ncbi:5150_t:CDS:2 [Funneliformis geosporum]|nr:5150_t:CDS:2 [Funneliformis geosporum]